MKSLFKIGVVFMLVVSLVTPYAYQQTALKTECIHACSELKEYYQNKIEALINIYEEEKPEDVRQLCQECLTPDMDKKKSIDFYSSFFTPDNKLYYKDDKLDNDTYVKNLLHSFCLKYMNPDFKVTLTSYIDKLDNDEEDKKYLKNMTSNILVCMHEKPLAKFLESPKNYKNIFIHYYTIVLSTIHEIFANPNEHEYEENY